MLFPKYALEDLIVGIGSIIGKGNIEDFFNHVSMHKDIEDRSLAELAPSYEVDAAYLVHMLAARFVRASLAVPVNARTEKLEFRPLNSYFCSVRMLAQNRAHKPKLKKENIPIIGSGLRVLFRGTSNQPKNIGFLTDFICKMIKHKHKNAYNNLANNQINCLEHTNDPNYYNNVSTKLQ
jgi:hypothetical protein